MSCNLLRAAIAVTVLFVLPGTAAAQARIAQFPLAAEVDRSDAAPVLRLDERALTIPDSPRAAQPPEPPPSRDSLKNGTIIGAVVGAVALGGFGALICNALQEPQGPSCLPGTLRIAAIGAAIGAGAGLAVDAAMTRQGGVGMSVGFRF